jgi:hypothetical protein
MVGPRRIAFILVIVLVVSPIMPVLAVDYVPGLTIGQYVKYGNFVYIVNGTENEVPMNWTRIDVTLVSGKNVTLLTTGQFKNGSPVPSNGSSSVYDVEAGVLNGSTEYTYGPIIAGNLSEGDPIPPLSYVFIVNKTEIRTYFGSLNRTVNILETTYSDPNYANHWLLVYDKVTGIMLESRFDWTDKASQTTTNTSYSVVETNITGSVVPELSSLPILMTGAILALIAVLFKKRNKRH